MPKPFFLVRPSGLFVRFLVPVDLRQQLAARFVIRRLYVSQPDQVRLAGARMGAALSEAFTQLRRGSVADFDDIKGLLDKHRRGELRDLTMKDVVLGDGTRLGTVEINTPGDLALFHAMRGAPAPAIATARSPVVLPSVEDSPFFEDTFETYRERRVLSNLTGDVDLRATQTIFVEMNGDKRLAEITDADILNFERATANWPVNARKLKAYRDMTAPEIVKASQARQVARDPELKLISDNTRRKHRDNLAAFFSWTVEKKKLAASPMEGDHRQQDHRIQRVQTRRPYRADELQRIFNPATFDPWWAGHPQYYWAPWIALYTGARLNEIAQLYLGDFQRPHGIPGIAFAGTRADQRVKGSNSVRFVPLAKPLLDSGLMRYVEEVRVAGHHRLFPHLKYGDDYGDYLGDRFISYLKSIGLKSDDNPDAPGMGFHWFRHTVGHAVVTLPNANLHTAAGITGHAQRSVVPGELASYVQPADLRAKLRALNKMKLPTPPPYEPDTFKDALAEAHALHAKWKRQAAARANAPAVTKNAKGKPGRGED